jgi:hypothetical protein
LYFISKQVWNATFSEELSFFMSSFIETEPFLAIVPCVFKRLQNLRYRLHDG